MDTWYKRQEFYCEIQHQKINQWVRQDIFMPCVQNFNAIEYAC
jgi:hypothetical protein